MACAGSVASRMRWITSRSRVAASGSVASRAPRRSIVASTMAQSLSKAIAARSTNISTKPSASACSSRMAVRGLLGRSVDTGCAMMDR